MSPRAFRTPESYYAEQVSRDMIAGFLEERGFAEVRDERKHHGNVESQTIHATAPSGTKRLVMRVRLCWRRRNQNHTYSAAQILPKIKNDDWEGTLQHKFNAERAQGIEFTLFIQRESGKRMSHAALIHNTDLLEIWCKQRDISTQLIEEGKLGRRKKNHAMNGSSPTIWLHDDKAPEVCDALWNYPGVIDLLKLDIVKVTSDNDVNDTYDDLFGYDPGLIGSDGAERVKTQKSHVKRDKRVRKQVIERSNNSCENCGTKREYQGFLDVHHILGVEKSDRVWNCVALCPNCHRETHFSPEQDVLNAQLLEIAQRYKSQ
jgi:5-methylcytosine-specific restriction protein A